MLSCGSLADRESQRSRQKPTGVMKACHAFHVIVTESLKFEMGFPSVLPCFFVLYWSYTYVHAHKARKVLDIDFVVLCAAFLFQSAVDLG